MNQQEDKILIDLENGQISGRTTKKDMKDHFRRVMELMERER